MIKSLILAAALTLIAALSSNAQRPQPAKPHAQPTFKTDLGNLPANYHGYDPLPVCRQLNQRRLIKGEYETTAGFETRLSQSKAIPLFAGVLIDEMMPFEISQEALEMEYYADSGRLSVTIKPDFVREGESLSGTFQRALPLKHLYDRSSSYVGTNAFGVRRRITRQTSTQINLAFDNYSGAANAYDIEFPVNASIARQTKVGLRAMAIFKLAGPYLTTGVFKDEPTITEPTDYSTLHLNLNGKLLAIWLYDLTTGRVYAKFNLEGREESSTRARLVARDAKDDAKEVDYTKVFTVKEVTRRAVITSKPEPEYLNPAMNGNFRGEVVLRIVLGANGRVSNIVSLTTQPDGITKSAIEAAKRLGFEPATKDGRKVSQYVTVAYNFNIY